MAKPKKKPASTADAHELVAETESGARNPTGAIPKKILFFVPLIWTLFQLWYASPCRLSSILCVERHRGKSHSPGLCHLSVLHGLSHIQIVPPDYIPFRTG
jgi:TRAP-type uncharacterized transport system fused permease subunit